MPSVSYSQASYAIGSVTGCAITKSRKRSKPDGNVCLIDWFKQGNSLPPKGGGDYRFLIYTPMTVKEVLEKVNANEEIGSKVLGAFCSLRHCIITQEDFQSKLDFSLTLQRWREIQDKAEICTDEEFLEIFPHLTDLV